MTIKMKNKIRITIPFLLVVLLFVVGGFYWYQSSQNKFAAPRKVAPVVKFRVDKQNTLIAVTGNLAYYGFVKDEEALKYALEHTKDNTPGKVGAIKVGNNTIDTETAYDISQSMSAWEIARILLNEGIPSVRIVIMVVRNITPLHQHFYLEEMLLQPGKSKCRQSIAG